MRINAIYEGGRLRFETPLALPDSPVHVIVEIPDSALMPDDLSEESRQLLADLDAIRNAPIPAEWDEEPSSKIDRLDAFARFRKD